MKIVTNGTIYEIRDNTIEINDRLPAQTYIVRFNKMTGFYMERYPDLAVKEEKIYGAHTAKVSKVLRTFSRFDRNLGIILSGNKGIGKSLFAKITCIESIKQGLPVIIVDSFIPGIASYLEKIDQEVVVLFDEFDKTFGDIRTSENEADPQAGLLSLFDGISSGKKMFIITCNKLNRLNDYLVNRPGRFHYHFRFDYPSDAETRDYLTDKLTSVYYSEIDKVIGFSKKVPLNYDCLRSIAFEINSGSPFEEAIQDLNIVNMSQELYNLKLYFEDGTIMTARHQNIDLFSDENTSIYLYSSNNYNYVDIEFNPANCSYDITTGGNIVYPANFKLIYSDDYDDETMARIKTLVPTHLTIQRSMEKSLHYNI